MNSATREAWEFLRSESIPNGRRFKPVDRLARLAYLDTVAEGDDDLENRFARRLRHAYGLQLILLVLAIGLVGMLATGGRSTPVLTGVEGAYPAHEGNRPIVAG